MSNSEVKREVKVGFREVITFLERAKLVFNVAILGTPTGDTRDAFTELNIERMELIENSKDIALYAKRLRGVLDKLVENAAALEMISSPENQEALQDRDILVGELVELVKT